MSAVTSDVNMNSRLRCGLIGAVLVGAILWAYWAVVREMVERWTDDPQYSHGYLVPLFSLFLLWHRRHLVPVQPARVGWLWLGLLLGGFVIRTASIQLRFA